MLTKFSRRVLQTISYTDQFEYPLTLFQIWQRLLEEKAPIKLVKNSVKQLQNQGLIESSQGYYFLTGRSSIISQRKKSELNAVKTKDAQLQLLQIVHYIPWIEAVAITGSVAMDVAAENDDLDILIVTKKETLWLTRFLLLFVASLVGRRRYWWEDRHWRKDISTKKTTTTTLKTKTKWCFNLWLTTNSLALPKSKQSIYSAYEVCQTQFIYDQTGIEHTFLEKNRWVTHYLPHFFTWKKCTMNFKPALDENLVFLLLRPFFIMADVVLFISQRLYMAGHMTTEKVSRSYAYFHPRPTKKMIGSSWQKSLREVIIKSEHTYEQKSSSLSERKPLSAFSLPEEVEEVLTKARKRKQKIVFVTGVFDMLHAAHRQFLVRARMTGDILVVGLESDKRVKELKGEGRPINNQQKRLKQMENLGVADGVFILPEDFSKEADHIAIIKLINPNILAVSAHSPHVENKKKIMKKCGGKVAVVMNEDRSVSTTKLLKQLGKA